MNPVVFYDGGCGLCHRAVKFLIVRDRAGVLRFAPLDGETARRLLHPVAPPPLPDSFFFLDREGRAHAFSDAVLLAAMELPRWRWAARAARWVPRGIRDAVYRAVAARRGRLFAKPASACPVVPSEWRARLLP